MNTQNKDNQGTNSTESSNGGKNMAQGTANDQLFRKTGQNLILNKYFSATQATTVS